MVVRSVWSDIDRKIRLTLGGDKLRPLVIPILYRNRESMPLINLMEDLQWTMTSQIRNDIMYERH